MTTATTKHPQVSVIVPAYNEEHNLPACLDALANQRTQYSFEVIVVDNASTDKTAQVVRSWIRSHQSVKPKVIARLVSEKRKGRGSARAAGHAVAQGKYLFSTDADAVVPPDWIEGLMEHFKESVGGVTSLPIFYDCSPTTKIFIEKTFPLVMHGCRFFWGHYWFNGFSLAVRKDCYDQVGGFDAGLNSMEDLELSWRVGKVTNIELDVRRKTRVLCSGRRFQKGLLKGSWDYTKALMFLVFSRQQAILDDVR